MEMLAASRYDVALAEHWSLGCTVALLVVGL